MIDTIGLAERLGTLLIEHRELSSRMRELEEEAKTIFSQMDDEFGPIPPRRTAPMRPRPLDDKIAISLGRSIALAVRSGWGVEKAKEMAVAKATQVAQRHGVNGLSAEMLKKIDRQLSRRLQTAA